MKQNWKIHRVMWGREEHPLTVFVPWDCGRHCPFCTTKREYETLYPANRLEANFVCLKESMRRMLEYGFVDEVVFTGGEPLADVDRLGELVAIANKGGCRAYVNTSLNLDDEQTERAIRFLVRACDGQLNENARVDGISVSFPYADVRMMNSRGYQALQSLFAELKDTPFNWCRINSVVRGTESPEQIRAFLSDLYALGKETLKQWNIWSVNLRKDYSTCDQTNLNDCCDSTMRTLMSMPELHYIGHGGCLVCRNDVFALDYNSDENRIPRLTYHRGVENTSLRYADFLVINDLVVKPDGEIRYDWCPGTPLPKRVMDVFARNHCCNEIPHADEKEWKWKNPLFATHLTIGGEANGRGCRDRPWERCG